VHLDLGGMPVTLLDTAGIRDTDDPVEHEGVRRAQTRAAEADLVLWVVDAAEREAAQPQGPERGEVWPKVWLVRNKADLDQGLSESLRAEPTGGKNELKDRTNEPLKSMVSGGLTRKDEPSSVSYESRFTLSAATGLGLSELLGGLERHAGAFLAGSESALITRARHRRALDDALAALSRATARPMAEREDLLAEELRLAARALGRLTGRVDVEDVLDVIFRDFCIGK